MGHGHLLVGFQEPGSYTYKLHFNKLPYTRNLKQTMYIVHSFLDWGHLSSDFSYGRLVGNVGTCFTGVLYGL